VRASALNEELGQIQYIFTDKTGTLTQNRMELSKLSINGVKFVHDLGTAGELNVYKDFSNLSDAISKMCFEICAEGLPNHPLYHLIVNLLVCSGTLISRQGVTVRYLSPSPDEVAFAEALDLAGVRLISRSSNNQVTIEFQGEEYVYETLATLEFQSRRLRMTVVSKDRDGNIFAYCKGADAKMLPDDEKGTGIIGYDQVELIRTTVKHMDEFASAGSRIMVIGYKQLKLDEFAEF